MSNVIHGNAGGNQLNASEDKAQVYGLKGKDTLTSDNKKSVLLVGGSGDDSLVMAGGNGTLSGGKGDDTFELTYSADKKLSAVIEDFEPGSDKIVVNYDGDISANPQLTSNTLRSGDVVLRDNNGLFDVTLKSVRENDYFDGSGNAANDERLFEILSLTNNERENPTMPEEPKAPDAPKDSDAYKMYEEAYEKYKKEYAEQERLVKGAKNLPPLTLSEGLAKGASIRAKEITGLAQTGALSNHTRPDGTNYDSVLEGKYSITGENLHAGEEFPADVVSSWIGSLSHHKNILDERFNKLGVGYNYEDMGGMSESRYYWAQMFADSLSSPTRVNLSGISTPPVNVVSKSVTLTSSDSPYNNDVAGATISGTSSADSIVNTGLVVSISGNGGSDTIENKGSFTTISAGAGDDSIKLSSDSNLIQYRAGDGNDIVDGFDENDTLSIVDAEYTPVTIGRDVIVSVGSYSINLRGAANLSIDDNIDGTRSNLIVDLEGSNSIFNDGANFSISSGGGDDTIENSGSGVTVNAGKGDDEINLDTDAKNNLIQYTAGDGNDTVDGFNEDDTLSIAGDEYTPVKIGEDLVVAVGNDSITLLDAASLSSPNIDGTRSKLFIGTPEDNTIINSVDDATIQALGGNDSIKNSGKNVSIDAGEGNNSIDNSNGTAIIHLNGNATIDNFHFGFGEGSDTIYISGESPAVDFKAEGLSLYKNSGSVTFKNVQTTSRVNLYYDSSNELAREIFIADNDWYKTSDNELDGNPLYFVGATAKMNHGVDFSNVTKDLDVTLNTEYASNNANLWVNNVHSIKGGAGNTTIHGSDKNDSIVAGTGLTTIDGGKGNDYISLPGDAGENLIEYRAGDGSDTVIGFDANDTLQIGGGSGTYSTKTSGDDVIVTVGDGRITLRGVADLPAVKINGRYYIPSISPSPKFVTLGGGNDSYSNSVEGATIVALGSDVTVENYVENVSILGGDGNDSIFNWYGGNNVSINGGDGNDTIFNDGNSVTIDGGAGDDYIDNFGDSVSIEGGDGNDSIYSPGGNSVSISGGDGDDSIYNWGWNSTIDGGAGDDYIDNFGDSVSIEGGDGDDSIYNWGWNSTIDGGAGDDYIENWGSNSTIDGGAGDDSIESHAYNATINGGAGNDRISLGSFSLSSYSYDNLIQYTSGDGYDTVAGFNDDDTLQIGNGTGTYSTQTSGNDVVVNVGSGSVLLEGAASLSVIHINNEAITLDKSTPIAKDNVITLTEKADVYSNTYNDVAIEALSGNDNITNRNKTNVSISGAADNDSLYNYANKVTLDGGDGNDLIQNGNFAGNSKWLKTITRRGGSNVSINGGAGDDTITNNGIAVSIVGGTGNDRISLSSDSQNNFVRYTEGDGNDTIWGIKDNDTLNLLPSTVEFSKERVVNTNDILIKIGNGSILLKDAANKRTKITLGESGTSGGTVGDGGGKDNSASGNDGSGGDGGKDNSQGGPSTNEGNTNAATQGRSAVGRGGRGGRGNSTGISGNDSGSRRNPTALVSSSTTQQTSANTFDDVLDSLKPKQPTATSNQHVYTGDNRIISNYQSGEKIIFGAVYTGSFFDGTGNYCVGAATGALVVQNAMDKVIDLSDNAGNAFVKAYAATNAGVIDGRGIAGFEIINGSAGADLIFAGDGGSQLWGGADTAADTLVGGNGTDIFISGKTQGGDIFLNASSADIVHLNDATLSDIIATEENNGAIAIAFNTGNAVAVQSTEPLSAAVMLADGSAYRYNHENKSWQNA